MQTPAICLIVFVVAFAGMEISRWRRAELSDVLTPVQKIRRLIGLGVLLILGIMLYGGSLLPDPRLMPRFVSSLEVLYWLSFCLLTVPIPLIAFFEMKDSLMRGSQLRREIYKSVVTTPLDQLPNDSDPPQKPKV